MRGGQTPGTGEEKAHGDLLCVYKCLKEGCKENRTELFSVLLIDKMRQRAQTGTEEAPCGHQLTEHWHRLPTGCRSPPWTSPKAIWTWAWAPRSGCLCWSRGWNMDPGVVSKLSHSVILGLWKAAPGKKGTAGQCVWPRLTTALWSHTIDVLHLKSYLLHLKFNTLHLKPNVFHLKPNVLWLKPRDLSAIYFYSPWETVHLTCLKQRTVSAPLPTREGIGCRWLSSFLAPCNKSYCSFPIGYSRRYAKNILRYARKHFKFIFF